MLVMLAALFAVSIMIPFIYNRLGRKTFFILAAVLGVSFLWVLSLVPTVLEAAQSAAPGQPNAPPEETLPWIPQLGVELAFRMDALAAALSLLITGVGALVMLYCARYFGRRDRSVGPFAAELFAFAAAMLGLCSATTW